MLRFHVTIELYHTEHNFYPVGTKKGGHYLSFFKTSSGSLMSTSNTRQEDTNSFVVKVSFTNWLILLSFAIG